jgi:hypothetical protein
MLLKSIWQYWIEVSWAKVVLWCYAIWYATIVYLYFDPSVKLWLNSLGISAVIGTGLLLSVSNGNLAAVDRWQIMRLYLMPFGVSSFSALIKDRGFTILLSPKLEDNLITILACLSFATIVWIAKTIANKKPWQIS